MADQAAVPSSRAETRVIAMVMNGAVWKILATKRGLVGCLEKHQDNSGQHIPMPSLQEFTQIITKPKPIKVLLPDDPNSESPELTRSLSIDEFWDSGEDFQNKGCSIVRHVPAHSNRLAARV